MLDILESAYAKFTMHLPEIGGEVFATPSRASTAFEPPADGLKMNASFSSTPLSGGWTPAMPVQRTGMSTMMSSATGSLQGLVCLPEEKAR